MLPFKHITNVTFIHEMLTETLPSSVFNTHGTSHFRPAAFPGLASPLWPDAAVLGSTAVYKHRQFLFLPLQVGITISHPRASLITHLVTLYLACLSIIRSRALFHAPQLHIHKFQLMNSRVCNHRPMQM